MEILWEALFIFVLRVMGIARKYTCRAGFLPAGQVWKPALPHKSA